MNFTLTDDNIKQATGTVPRRVKEDVRNHGRSDKERRAGRVGSGYSRGHVGVIGGSRFDPGDSGRLGADGSGHLDRSVRTARYHRWYVVDSSCGEGRQINMSYSKNCSYFKSV